MVEQSTRRGSRVALVLLLIQFVTGQKEFACPDVSEPNLGNGMYADPVKCGRYYSCVNGYAYLSHCPSGLHFDDINKSCMYPEEARCGPIPSTPAPSTEAPVDLAIRCDPSDCELPYCYCSKDGTTIPGDLEPEQVPQMILLTFDGGINLNNFDHYKRVFTKIKNPNGCPAKGTFFVAHEYSNYAMVQSLAHDGHEIATETVSLQQGLENKGYEEWAGEMIGMREILGKFANISRSDIVGMRAPFLKPGRNTQYNVLEDFGYVYDSSIGTPPLPVPIWPYTLDYKVPHECKSETCPTRSFPGIWEVPLNAHYIETYEGGHCPYLDQCVLHNHNSDEVVEWLQEDFSRYYEQNRAPYMMPFHTNWFQIRELEQGLHKFLHWMSKEYPDIWFVTVTQALTWMTSPKSIKEVKNYDAWACDKKQSYASAPCKIANKCALAFRVPEKNISDTRYMETCYDCPIQYPWLGDSGGTGIPGKDNYIPDNLRK